MSTPTAYDGWMHSVDDHLIEPPSVWVDRLPAAYRERGPRWITDDLGEAWHIEGNVRVAINGAVTAAAFPPERKPPSFQPLAWSEIPPSCHDPIARAEAMDADHVLASLPFPHLPGFAGRVFQNLEDKDLALLCIQAYNDWMLEEFAAAIPGRIIGVALIPMWDGRLAAEEAERALGKGACSISFSMAPHRVGFPPIDHEHWDPLFSVMSNAELPLCAHLGTGFATDPGLMVKQSEGDGDDPGQGPNFSGLLGLPPGPGRRGRNPAIGALLQMSGEETLIDWLTSGNFERHPKLTLALSENGIGWIPALLQGADVLARLTRSGGTSPSDPENDVQLTDEARLAAQRSIEAQAARAKDAPLPSEVFRDHIYGCFIHDPLGLKMIDEIGADNVMIETDFPHITSWWPHSMAQADEALRGLDDDVRWKVLRGNAERVFKFTPAEPPALTSAAGAGR
jgi:predicted TIM-barrel fold metal-dependent hydrolase